MKHTAIKLTAFLLCTLLLTSCSAKPEKEPSTTEEGTNAVVLSTEDSTAETTASVSAGIFSKDANASIDAVRKDMTQTPSEPTVFGVCYIGYFEYIEETGIDFDQWFLHTASPISERYSFLSEIDKNHTIGTKGHLYCIIAKDYNSSISVNSIESGELLYRSENGDPILVFANRDGDTSKSDIAVTIKTPEGSEYKYEPKLDNLGYAETLVGDERKLLSWDLNATLENNDFDLEEWLVNDWGGPTAVGLAYDKSGTDWWISTWDNSEKYCLSFYLDENGGYDGEAILQCFHEEDSTVQAQWQGNWRIEAEADQPSKLYLDMKLMSGADKSAFESSEIISESYRALVSISGNYLLLVADSKNAILPIFPDGVQSVELALADG